ncbi:putative B3 domain-containing protein At1g78640 [Eucalyptus grandis]|uniref:putative B3 domain-containing protein At1g78640 n=1 Tax=Eucalyptus grandis TaxID=71139 RepID=UPI00192E90CD|nr:putative B3 domain-containing protein At1g78640 [Eucalyptus grandis]
MTGSSPAPPPLIDFLGSPGNFSSSPIQNADTVTPPPNPHTGAMTGSSSDPPPLIDFLGSPRNFPSSPIQNADIVTHQEERNRSSDVSTELTLRLYPGEITKKLTKSDVDHSARLLLPLDCLKAMLRDMDDEMRRQVESTEGMGVGVVDLKTGNEYQLVFRRWGSSRSYVLNSGWTKLFVKRQGLKVGDEVGMCWNKGSRKFYFKVL